MADAEKSSATSNCDPNLTYQLSADGLSITGVALTASGNTCSVPVPLSVPGTASGSGSFTTDKVGSEPTIYWAALSGSPVSFTLGSPVAL